MNMNKLFLIVLMFLLFPAFVNGQTLVVNQDITNKKVSSSFQLKTNEVLEMKNSKDDIFNFEVTKVSKNIDHWKLLVACDDGLSVLYEDDISNICNNAVKIESFRNQKFYLTFRNNQITDNFVNFSFRLKAYDKEDRWLQTEKKSFKWK